MVFQFGTSLTLSKWRSGTNTPAGAVCGSMLPT